MSALLGAYKWPVYLGLVLALVLGALAGRTHIENGGIAIGEARVQAKWDADKLAAQELRLRNDRLQSAENDRKQAIADKEAEDANTKLTHARADAVIADAAAGKLRGQLAAYVAAARRAAQTTGIATAGPGQPGTDPLDLLAELYSRSDEAAGTIAQYADQLRIAGASAERIADEVNAKATPQPDDH